VARSGETKIGEANERELAPKIVESLFAEMLACSRGRVEWVRPT